MPSDSLKNAILNALQRIPVVSLDHSEVPLSM